MSVRADFRSLSVVSSAMTSSASMIGIPAFTKTPSCREKCIRSLRGTLFLVISNWRTLFFGLTSTDCRPRSSSARWAAPRVAADSVPETFFPFSSIALYLNVSTPYRLQERHRDRSSPYSSRSQSIDAAYDLRNRRDVLRHQADRFLSKRAHPL